MFSERDIIIHKIPADKFAIDVTYSFKGSETVKIDSDGMIQIPGRFWKNFRSPDRECVVFGSEELQIEFDERTIVNKLKEDSVFCRLWPWTYFNYVACHPYREYIRSTKEWHRVNTLRFSAHAQPLKLTPMGGFNIKSYSDMIKEGKVVLTPIGSYFLVTRPSDHRKEETPSSNFYKPKNPIKKPTGMVGKGFYLL